MPVWRRFFSACVLALAAGLIPGAGALRSDALAQDAAKDLPPAATPVSPSDEPSLFAFGDRNPGCAEWGDACQVCQRGTDGSVNCSTSGIACTPAKLVCKRPVAVAKPPIEPAPLPKAAEPVKPAAPEPMFPESSSPY